MFLPMNENIDLSNENIAYEVGIACRTIEMSYSAINTGDYDSLTASETKHIAKSVMDKNSPHHDLYLDCLKLRDYGPHGKFDADIPDPKKSYTAVLMSIPAAELYGGGPAFACSAILQAVVARSKIDRIYRKELIPTLDLIEHCQGFSTGHHFKGLTLYELSLLTTMTVQSVKNELRKPNSPKTNYEHINENDEIQDPNFKIPNLVTVDVEEAYKWLKGRRGFIDTYFIKPEQNNQEATYLVPQAKDGSLFSPECKLLKGFKIGKKGEEVYVDDFEKALKLLQAMPKAYWRRPSPTSGISGIVSSTTWVHKDSEELNLDN
jgi:hypothetical protein